MFIVKIEVQKKMKNRFNVYVDKGFGEEYAFSVGEDVLVKHRLRKGMELDELDIEAILLDDQMKTAYNQALTYLGYRMRTEKEVCDYLARKNIDERVMISVIEELKTNHYIDDQEFAKAFVRTQMKTALKGPNFIKRELEQKGVARDVIEDALQLFSKEEQIEKAYQLAEKQLRKKEKISLAQLGKKMEQMLLRKGFPYDVIEAVLEKLPMQDDGGMEWEAVVAQGEKGKRKYSHLKGLELRTKVAQFLYRKGFSQDLIQQYINQELEEIN